MPRKAKIEVGIKVLLIKEGKYIVAYSPELDFSSFGINDQDAMKAFDEGVKLFLEEIYKMGTLEKVLLDLGWTLQKKPVPDYTPPTEYKNKISSKGSVSQFHKNWIDRYRNTQKSD